MTTNNLPPRASEHNARLVAALEYAARGWPVFPLHGIRASACTCGKSKCGSPGKHPRTQHGKDEATIDAATITAWWQRWPDANVGGLMGEASGVIALDVDPPKGEASLATSLNGSGLPATPISRTGRGRHVLFAHPGRSNRNRAGLRPGLDVRGDGGYIVLPPSNHESGTAYAWQDGSEHLTPAPMPGWLLKLMEKPAPPPRANATAPRPSSGRDAYAEAALRKELEAVAHAPEGVRNDALNRAAFNLGQLVAGGYLECARLEAELFTAAEDCGLVRDDGDQAARNTIRSGLEDGRQQPRRPREQPRPPQTEDRPPLEEQSLDQLNPTDLGNAERFATQHHGRVRYCHPWREWMTWDGRRWTRDRTGEVWRVAKLTVRDMLHEAAGLEDDRACTDLTKHAMRSEAQRRIAAMLELAKSDLRIAVLPEAFDPEGTRYLLNVENGTIDIRSGELGPHRRENMISKLAPVRYEPGARSALWAKFLMRVLPDPEVRAFLARYVGSCLSGDANDRRVLLFYGTGDNGKSVLASVLLRLLGDYAHPARFDSFLESRPDRAGGARSDLMGLRGKRLVTAIEANPGRHFNEGLLKSFAGGSDRITARGLYDRDDTTFAPEAKLLLVANHRPEVQGGGDSIWNRLCEVPFSVTVPKAEQDPHLVRRLCEPIELSSILNWALEGAAEWYAVTEGDRLRPPDAVLRATAAYRTEQDPTAGFVHEQCELGPDYRCTSKALWAAFRAWSEQAGEFLISRKRFGMSMIAEHQCRPVQMGPKRDRGLAGIRLRDVCDSDGGERI